MGQNVCADYKLVALMLPLMALIRYEGRWTSKEFTVFTCLLFVMIPKNYVYLFSDVSASCLLDPILLVGCLLVA
jgi:hypothetical protein